MPVKIEYLGLNNPSSPVYANFPNDGFVVSADGVGYVNVQPKDVWYGVEMFGSMADEERHSFMQSVISAVEDAHFVGHEKLDQKERENLYDDVGVLFGACVSALGITPNNQDQLAPFIAFFDLTDPRPHDAEGNLLTA